MMLLDERTLVNVEIQIVEFQWPARANDNECVTVVIVGGPAENRAENVDVRKAALEGVDHRAPA